MTNPIRPLSFGSLSRGELLALILLFSGVFFRVIRVDFAPEVLPNFSPLMASALCGALFLPGTAGIFIPLIALLLSDAVLNIHYAEPIASAQILWTLPCYLVAGGVGVALRSDKKNGADVGLLPVLCCTLAVSLLFYLVTNTGSWLGNSYYPQTVSGWIQALTTGRSGYPPTWTFLRNSLCGDLLFAAIFVSLERILASRVRSVATVY
jgi:hypothetical protein